MNRTMVVYMSFQRLVTCCRSCNRTRKGARNNLYSRHVNSQSPFSLRDSQMQNDRLRGVRFSLKLGEGRERSNFEEKKRRKMLSFVGQTNVSSKAIAARNDIKSLQRHAPTFQSSHFLQ